MASMSNSSTNNENMVEKAKRDVVSELHLSNYKEAELLEMPWEGPKSCGVGFMLSGSRRSFKDFKAVFLTQ